MKIELLHVVNGYRKFHLGFYDDMHQAIKALKKSCICLFSYFRTTL